MARSRLWRIANYMGLVEEAGASPRRGSASWWLRLAGLVVVIAVVVITLRVLR